MATPTSLPASFVSGAVLTAAQMNNLRGAFRILQVVQDTKTDTFSTTSTSFVDVTGLEVTITPSATSSQVLIIASVSYGNDSTAAAGVGLTLSGGNVSTYVSTRDFTKGYRQGGYNSELVMLTGSMLYLDSPATTSATTYKVRARAYAGTAYINRDGGGTAGQSSIIVAEVSA